MSMAYVAVAVAVVSAAVGSYSAYAQGENAKEAADYNAKVQENAALDAQQRGSIAAAEHQDKVRRLIGTQTATAAANGLLTNTGTPLDILVDTAGMGKLDALRLLSNANREANGLNAQAGLLKIEGDNAKTAGTLNAAGHALSGLSSAAGGAYKGGFFGKAPTQTNATGTATLTGTR